MVPLSECQASDVNTKCRSIKWKHHCKTPDLTLVNLSNFINHRMVRLAWKYFKSPLRMFKIFQTPVEDAQNISNTFWKSWKICKHFHQNHTQRLSPCWTRYRACMLLSLRSYGDLLDPCCRSEAQDDNELPGEATLLIYLRRLSHRLSKN